MTATEEALYLIAFWLAFGFGMTAAILWAYHRGVKDGHAAALAEARKFNAFVDQLESEKGTPP